MGKITDNYDSLKESMNEVYNTISNLNTGDKDDRKNGLSTLKVF